jgi:prepilin peptidase CpaA
MISLALLLALLAVASYTDLRWGKIYNKAMYPGILAGLTLNLCGTIAEWQWDEAVAQKARGIWGWVAPHVRWMDTAIADSAMGFLGCGFVLVVCFVFLRTSGGDVKLTAMLGAFLGVEQGLLAMLWMFVLYGALGLVILIWRVGAWKLLVRCTRQLLTVLHLASYKPLDEQERTALKTKLSLAPAAIPAVLIVKFGWLTGVL